MAEEVALKVSVDVGEGGKSLKSLKEEFKNTQKELDGLQVGSEKYIKTLGKLGKIKDEIGDLNEEIAAFKPEGKVEALGKVIGGVASGFEAATGAAALFGGENKDLEKTLIKVQAAMAFTEGIKGLVSLGDGFKVLGNIIKSNPIYLIASIVIGVGVALYALKDKLGVVGKAFDAIGDVIHTVVQAIKDFTDWIGITNNAADDLAEKQIENARKTGQAVSDRYDREIARAQAAGKNTLDLEKKKQEAIIKTLRLEAEAIVSNARANGAFTEDQNKRFTELISLTQKASDEIAIINIKKNEEVKAADKKSNEEYKKHLEERKAADKKYHEELIKLQQEAYQNILAVRDDLEAQEAAKRKAAYDAQIAAGDADLERTVRDATARQAIEKQYADTSFANKLEYLDQQKQIELSNKDLTEAEKFLIEEKYAEQSKALKKQQVDQELNVVSAGINAAAALTDLYFSGQIKKAKGNAAAELALKKKQFKIEKAFNIVRATIDGVRSVQAALTQSPPLSYVLAAFNGVLAAANIAKIASSKFDGGETGGGGGSVPIPSVAAPGSSSAPSLNAPNNSSTLLNPDGTVKKNTVPEQPLVKAIVTETDITKTQGRVNTIKEMATIR